MPQLTPQTECLREVSLRFQPFVNSKKYIDNYSQKRDDIVRITQMRIRPAKSESDQEYTRSWT
jgi:hypothetical protein